MSRPKKTTTVAATRDQNVALTAEFNALRCGEVSALTVPYPTLPNKTVIELAIAAYHRGVLQSALSNSRLGSIDYGRLAREQEAELRNRAYIDVFRGALGNLISDGGLGGERPASTAEEKVREWLTEIKFLSSGAYGSTVDVKLNGESDLFVLKYPKRMGDILSHEYAVGIAVNQLRSSERWQIPNFVYTYLRFGCTAPIEEQPAERAAKIKDAAAGGESHVNAPMTWCHLAPQAPATGPGGRWDDKVSSTVYLVQEKVRGADTLHHTIGKGLLPYPQFLSVTYQLIYALRIARINIGFTHRDCHASNILVRILPSSPGGRGRQPTESDRWIPYECGDPARWAYVKTLGVIPTLIDYGMASSDIDFTLGDAKLSKEGAAALLRETRVGATKPAILGQGLVQALDPSVANQIASGTPLRKYTVSPEWQGANPDLAPLPSYWTDVYRFLQSAYESYWAYANHPDRKPTDVAVDRQMTLIKGLLEGIWAHGYEIPPSEVTILKNEHKLVDTSLDAIRKSFYADPIHSPYLRIVRFMAISPRSEGTLAFSDFIQTLTTEASKFLVGADPAIDGIVRFGGENVYGKSGLPTVPLFRCAEGGTCKPASTLMSRAYDTKRTESVLEFCYTGRPMEAKIIKSNVNDLTDMLQSNIEDIEALETSLIRITGKIGASLQSIAPGNRSKGDKQSRQDALATRDTLRRVSRYASYLLSVWLSTAELDTIYRRLSCRADMPQELANLRDEIDQYMNQHIDATGNGLVARYFDHFDGLLRLIEAAAPCYSTGAKDDVEFKWLNENAYLILYTLTLPNMFTDTTDGAALSAGMSPIKSNGTPRSFVPVDRRHRARSISCGMASAPPVIPAVKPYAFDSSDESSSSLSVGDRMDLDGPIQRQRSPQDAMSLVQQSDRMSLVPSARGRSPVSPTVKYRSPSPSRSRSAMDLVSASAGGNGGSSADPSQRLIYGFRHFADQDPAYVDPTIPPPVLPTAELRPLVPPPKQPVARPTMAKIDPAIPMTKTAILARRAGFR